MQEHEIDRLLVLAVPCKLINLPLVDPVEESPFLDYQKSKRKFTGRSGLRTVAGGMCGLDNLPI
jgi:hypothetical protein